MLREPAAIVLVLFNLQVLVEGNLVMPDDSGSANLWSEICQLLTQHECQNHLFRELVQEAQSNTILRISGHANTNEQYDVACSLGNGETEHERKRLWEDFRERMTLFMQQKIELTRLVGEHGAWSGGVARIIVSEQQCLDLINTQGQYLWTSEEQRLLSAMEKLKEKLIAFIEKLLMKIRSQQEPPESLNSCEDQ
ncbi:hypothetical protein QAD02_001718, partial [Eretmocerus hayati]